MKKVITINPKWKTADFVIRKARSLAGASTEKTVSGQCVEEYKVTIFRGLKKETTEKGKYKRIVVVQLPRCCWRQRQGGTQQRSIENENAIEGKLRNTRMQGRSKAAVARSEAMKSESVPRCQNIVRGRRRSHDLFHSLASCLSLFDLGGFARRAFVVWVSETIFHFLLIRKLVVTI